MAEKKLHGRVAVVTGGGRGIGRAISEAYAREGAAIALAARTPEEVEAAAAAITRSGGEAVGVVTDVTSDESVEALARRAQEELGPVDVVVNSAGSYAPARFLDYDMADVIRMMDVNYLAAVRTIRAFVPGMIDHGWGRIINISSTAGKYGSAFQSPYNASKHAVVGLTRSLGLEFAGTGVRINAICPGFVDTPMLEENKARWADILGVSEDEAVPTLVERRVPIGRLLDPAEVAELAVYLASPDSDAMTGQALTISGGLILV